VSRLSETAARALAYWQRSNQLDQVIEELAECVVAINHWRRGRCGPERVAEELVDALLVLEQLRQIIDSDVGPGPKVEEYQTALLVRVNRDLDKRGASRMTLSDMVAVEVTPQP
jgi:hypothetical protein